MCLIHQSNKNAKIAIKTASGIIEKINISNKIMQGRVWGGLMCTTTMDKLCKLVYEDEKVLYRYRGIVLCHL